MLEPTGLDLTKIFYSRGPDGLSRLDRQRLQSGYKRTEYLFERFLNQRKKETTLQLKHEHILDIGELIRRKFEQNVHLDSTKDSQSSFKLEADRMQQEAEIFKEELRKSFIKKFEEDKEDIKKSYESQMKLIEKQRDEVEEERVRDVIRKMNEECELALERQWADAEELKVRTINKLKEEIRHDALQEVKQQHDEAIAQALEKAEIEFLKRELAAVEKTRLECELENKVKLKEVCEKYDASIENLLRKLKDSEYLYAHEHKNREKIENDFRLLQTDYRRFMNYTDHYNSDYLLKLRHIGAQILEDKEFESKLNEKLEVFDIKNFKNKNYKRDVFSKN